MGQILWTCHLLAAQGQYVPTTTIYQGNKSTILLAENDNSSSSKKKHHLNVRYYFITDQIKKENLKVAFCPSQDMLADLFTKPLQGALFICMQEKGLNLPAIESINMHRTVLEDRKIKYEKEKDTQGTRGGRVCQESRG